MKYLLMLILCIGSINSLAKGVTNVNETVISIKEGCKYGGWFADNKKVTFIAVCGVRHYTFNLKGYKGNLDEVSVVYSDQVEKIKVI